MVAGNFERALVTFAPQRLVTEGVIFFNATIWYRLKNSGNPS
jgi:hypothetical protein